MIKKWKKTIAVTLLSIMTATMMVSMAGCGKKNETK